MISTEHFLARWFEVGTDSRVASITISLVRSQSCSRLTALNLIEAE